MRRWRRKPYLSFSYPFPGAASFLWKKAAEKNAGAMRELAVERRRQAMNRLADVRPNERAPGLNHRQILCGGVPCEWIDRPENPPGKVIVYLHGGSWCFGNLHTARAVGYMLSEASGYRVLTVEYRLAPEHPFPAGLADCAAVYERLLEEGFQPDGIALFGDSAGGNLALALLHRLQAEGKPLPAAVGLASPATDLSSSGILAKESPDQLYIQFHGMEQGILDLYCGEEDREHPLLSPRFGELGGFPPMLIHVGQDESLCLDCDRFAQKAYQSGVDVSLKIWRGMYHDFTIVGRALKESRRSLSEFGLFFQKHLGA